MLRMAKTLLIAAGLTTAAAAMAQDTDEDTGPWSGKAALGYLATSGNAENSNVNASVGLYWDSGRWHHSADALAVHATDTNTTTAEAYSLALKTKYDFSEFNYVFGLVDWNKDKFSGYDQQTSEVIGYGRRLINNDRHVLNLEIGAGARQSDLRDGTSQNETVVRGGLDYVLALSDTSEFSQAVVVESGSDNTFLESISAIKATLLGNVALVASYTIRQNTDVPAGSEKTDTFTAVSLEYAF